MKNIGYDRLHALRLVPLLRSIMSEVCERSTAIAQLETHLEKLSRPRKKGPEFYDLRARLATHRRELRLTRKELSHLGCVLDGNHPMRVRIPGNSGELSHGYTWVADEETTCARVSESLAH